MGGAVEEEFSYVTYLNSQRDVMIEYYTKCNPDIWFYDDVTTFTFTQINNSTKEYFKGEMQDQFEIIELSKTINFALSQTMKHDASVFMKLGI